MENIGEIYYEAGIRCFELEKYEAALTNWIRAYETGYAKESILENIYNCFIMPNEREFRENYTQGSAGYTELPFEACALDFIPLSEDEFYIFDREETLFRGAITLEKNPVQGEHVQFNNILYTNTWDIREMLPDMKENRRDAVYMLLEGVEEKFASFFKLPQFKELYLGNVITFHDTELMRTVFEENEEYYLPKQLVTAEPEKYWEFVREIHEKRIHNLNAERKNIFLSICIPSYNRGKIALENVKHLLSCPYDSEIEIVVSNNGSTDGVKEYHEIENIGDARVQYHEFAENQGFAANILKVCGMAKGKYAVLVSDEDWIMLENFDKYLSILKAHPSVGVFVTSVVGHMGFKKDAVRKPGIEAIHAVFTISYLTGFTYNMTYLKKIKVLEVLERMRIKHGVDWKDEADMSIQTEKRNLYLETVTHVCMAVMLCRYKELGEIAMMDLWDVETNCTEEQGKFGPFGKPESRMEMQNSFMDFCYQTLKLSVSDFLVMFLDYCSWTHELIRMTIDKYPEDMLKMRSEWQIHVWIYREQIKYLDSFPIPIEEGVYRNIQRILARS